MKQVALFAPVSPVRSALVDHIEGLLPDLAMRYDLTLVVNGTYRPEPPPSRSGDPIQWMTVDDFQAKADGFDLVIYQLGDEANIHGYMFENLHKHPGLVLLHDLVLHHAVVELTLNRGNVDGYLAEMRYAYGQEGELAAHQVISGQEAERVFSSYPLSERVVDSSLAVVGFNSYMCDQIEQRRPQATVYRTLYPYYMPCIQTEAQSDLKRPVIASFGLFNSQKRLELMLDAFQTIAERHAGATYRLVGAPKNDLALNSQIAARGLTGRVIPSGWLDRTAFCQEMAEVDIALQLRYPHVGGMPYTPIRLLGLGVPTIISAIEPLAEIPSDAVVRIAPNVAEEQSLVVAALDYLLTHRSVAQAMGDRGRAYVAGHHDQTTQTQAVCSIIDDVIARRAELVARARRRRLPEPATGDDSALLIRVAAAALSELGIPSYDQELCPIAAQAIADLSVSAPPRSR